MRRSQPSVASTGEMPSVTQGTTPFAWFPGWQAEVDGAPAQLYRANVDFKAVYVPPSAENVVLTYNPRSVHIGALASLCFVGLTILLFFHRALLSLIPVWRRRHEPITQDIDR